MQKIAIFPGSFDPFTIGHESVVNRSLSLFDKIIIMIGYNANKKSFFSIEKRVKWINQVFQNVEKIEVKIHDEILAKKYEQRLQVKTNQVLRDAGFIIFQENKSAANYLLEFTVSIIDTASASIPYSNRTSYKANLNYSVHIKDILIEHDKTVVHIIPESAEGVSGIDFSSITKAINDAYLKFEKELPGIFEKMLKEI